MAAGERPATPTLLIMAGPRAGQKIALAEGRPVVFGRDPRSDVHLDDPRLSRRHCMIEWRAGSKGHVSASDLLSANGTTVNNRKIDGTVRLNHGDVVALGDSIIALALPEGAAADDETPLPDAPATTEPKRTGKREQVRIRLHPDTDAQLVAAEIRKHAWAAHFADDELEQIETAVREVVTNAIKHGGGGGVVAVFGNGQLQIEVFDKGPGLDPDLARALTTGHVSLDATSGIAVARRFMDEFSIASKPGGTQVIMRRRSAGS